MCGLVLLLGMGNGRLRAEDSADQIQVLRTHWGFDGRLSRRMFLPLSVKLHNTASQPWTGTLRLTRFNYNDQQRDAPIELPVTLAPDEITWVQLVPYIVQEWAHWELEWGTGPKNRLRFQNLEFGGRATVLIVPDEESTELSGRLPRMPQDCFPASLTGTDGLYALFLDADPDWSAGQVQAFLDWLESGGRVVLLHSKENAYPVFSERLSVLNQKQERFAVRQGTVVRRPVRPEEFDPAELRSTFTDPLRDREGGRTDEFARWSDRRSVEEWPRDQLLLDRLAEQVQFRRNWLLINLAVIGYLIVLFPVCYRVGFHQKRVKAFYITFLGMVFSFSLIFWMLGQLGSNVRNRISSGVIAKFLGHGRFDITHWSQLASARGGEGTVRHLGEGIWYTSCEEEERINGVYRGGEHPSATIRFPAASTCALLHRTVQQNRRPAPGVSRVSYDGPVLSELVLSAENAFESPPVGGVVIHNEMVYHLAVRGEELELDRTRQRVSLYAYLSSNSTWKWDWWNSRIARQEKTPLSKQDDAIPRILVGNSYGLSKFLDARYFEAGRGKLRVVIFTALPKTLQAESPTFLDQQGTVAWVYDLPVPGQL